MTLCDVFYSFGQGLSKAGTCMAGQALGCQSQRQLYEVRRVAIRQGFYLSLVAALLYFVFREQLMGYFSTSSEVILLGSHILLVVAVACLPQTQSLICSGMLRGLGHTRYVAKYSLWSIAIVRPILTWVLCFPLGLGLYGAWIALFIDQTTRMICAWVKLQKEVQPKLSS